uniref:Small ribosomal subunit protein uS2c n=1 Tax=Ephedra altissima TaxID=3391 RepID=A0A8F4TDR4_EPHAL|nr:ribosomal protein S2 [Ephedra altissima]QXG15809.1 ribosomal protein S2 [Ephedra altissima]
MTNVFKKKRRVSKKNVFKDMIKVAVHLGHQKNELNPKMRCYILTERGNLHIINLVRTILFLSEACDLLMDAARKRKEFLLVGTKGYAADLIASTAKKTGCHYINYKWQGGLLTNWSTTKEKLERFRNLKQKYKSGLFHRKRTKKEIALIEKQLELLQQYLEGIFYMKKLPDIVIIVDQQKESTAVRECRALGIPTISLVDTNCDPDFVDIPIPANDDARGSVGLILNKLMSAVSSGYNN